MVTAMHHLYNHFPYIPYYNSNPYSHLFVCLFFLIVGDGRDAVLDLHVY